MTAEFKRQTESERVVKKANEINDNVRDGVRKKKMIVSGGKRGEHSVQERITEGVRDM